MARAGREGESPKRHASVRKHIGAKVKRPWHPTLRKKMNGEVVPR
jgi:hypothetical protein